MTEPPPIPSPPLLSLSFTLFLRSPVSFSRFQALMRPDRVAPSVSPRFLLSRGHPFFVFPLFRVRYALLLNVS